MHDSTQSIHAALLPFLGVLRFFGADAARFLQGQVTHDTQLLAKKREIAHAEADLKRKNKLRATKKAVKK